MPAEGKLELCGDKKNRNPHVFPIFLVDYPFIRKGHSFIMDSNNQARAKDGAKRLASAKYFAAPSESFAFFAVKSSSRTTKLAKADEKYRTGSWYLVLAAMVLIASGVNAQQPSSITRSNTRNAPPKASPTAQPSSQSRN
jgi:hypothetical protein